MNVRNYIELGILVVAFLIFLVIKLITRKKVSDMNGLKGENKGAPNKNGEIAGKLGREKR